MRANAITSDIIDKGLVLAYVSSDSQFWIALPNTFHYNAGGTLPYSESMNFQYSINQILENIQDNDFLTLQPLSIFYIKIVAILGTFRVRNPNINWKNYSEVEQRFNLTN